MRVGVFLCVLALVAYVSGEVLPQILNHCGPGGVVITTETAIPGYVDAVMGLQWLTNTVVYARSVVHNSGSWSQQSIIFRSDNGGKSWSNEMDKLKNSNVEGAYEVLPTATEGKAWITGTGSALWTTTDAGASYTLVSIPKGERHVTTLYPHPYFSDYALAITEPPSSSAKHFESLWATTDFGQSWKLVDSYVLSAQWAVDGLTGGAFIFNHTIIWTAIPAHKRTQDQSFDPKQYAVYHTEDWGKTKSMIRDRTPGFLVHQNAFFIAGWGAEATSPLALYVSLNGGSKFTQCRFPHDVQLSELNYIILDASYDSAIVFILHSLKNAWGHIYTSDSFDVTFELSLPFAVSYQPNGYGTSYPEWLRISRIPGLYISNVWDVGDSPGPSATTPIVTRATRNNGGTWEPLNPPKGSSCGGAKTCSLHLRGQRTSRFGSFYSDPDAIGLVVANGNVGSQLDVSAPNPNFYISRDAALTWFLVPDVAPGSKTFEFADHGAITIAANTGIASNQVFYSVTEGEQFVECNYTGDNPSVKRNILDIFNDPKMETASFIAMASKGGSSWVIEFFDFRAVFRRDCQGFDAPDTPDSDYEMWAPQFAEDEPPCFLGLQTFYIRRKQEAQCFNGEGFEVGVNVSNKDCACTLADYECTECYTSVVNNTGRFCVLSCDTPPPPAPPPLVCDKFYYDYTGWRKIANDQCVGSIPDLGIQRPCPKYGTKRTLLVVILVVIALIFAIIGGCWALTQYNPTVREFWSRTVPGIIAPTFGRANASSATYSLLKKPDSMDDDEEALAEGAQAKVLDDDTILNYSKEGKDGNATETKKDENAGEIL